MAWQCFAGSWVAAVGGGMGDIATNTEKHPIYKAVIKPHVTDF